MKSKQQLIGMKFGRLTVLECAGKDAKRNMTWKCLCECGISIVTRGSSLVNGVTKSCGCLVKERMSLLGKSNKTHGIGRSPATTSWTEMKQRCYNSSRGCYKNYGARGIKPCEFLDASPANLVSIIGQRPSGMSLDRINNEAGYTCGQCEQCKSMGWTKNIRWATRTEQNNNRRDNRRVMLDGVLMTASQWMAKTGKKYGAFRWQYDHAPTFG